MIDTLNKFSRSTRLRVNAGKCYIYFGVVEENTKDEIMKITSFKEGTIPFRYLGILLTNKKLVIKHYLSLINKIVGRINHWSAKLLTFASRIKLIKSVLFATITFWMWCPPLPKAVIHKIDVIHQSFLWTSGKEITMKSPIAWKKVCSHKISGGLNLIDLTVWNRVNIMKMIWNLSKKTDNLCSKWIHTNYIKQENMMNMNAKDIHSCITKKILQQNEEYKQVQNKIQNSDKFKMKEFFLAINNVGPKVNWYILFYHNMARPRSQLIPWLACNDKLAAKETQHWFGMIVDNHCVFCHDVKTIQHLLFVFPKTQTIWMKVVTNWKE